MPFGDWNGDGHVSLGEGMLTGGLIGAAAHGLKGSGGGGGGGDDDGCGGCCGCLMSIAVVVALYVFLRFII